MFDIGNNKLKKILLINNYHYYLNKNIKHHCQILKTIFEEYFKEDYSECFWIRNLLILNLVDIPRTLIKNEKES